MLKPKIKLLLVLALSCPLMCLAQQDPLYKYIRDVLPVNYTTSISYTDERYNWGRPSPDTLNVEVSKPEELQKLIDAKLNLKTYGVCLKADSATIGPMVSLLKQFPHVDFIKFNDASFFARDKKSFLLPPSIADVPHLNGVEFNLTFIDIRDALSKLASVKGLRLISYTGGLPIGPE